MSNLVEELARLANPAPVFRDPEDIDDDTVAKLSEPIGQSLEGDDDLISASQLRSKTAPLLADTDQRYAGKKVSRSRIEADDDLAGMFILEGGDEEHEDEGSEEIGEDEEEDMSEDEEEEEEEDKEESGSDTASKDEDVEAEESDEDEDGDDLSAFKKKMSGLSDTALSKQLEESISYSSFNDGEDDEDEDDISDESDAEDSDEVSDGDEEEDEEDTDEDEEEDVPPTKRRKLKSAEESDEEDGGGIKQFSKSSVDDEVAKGEATKSQLSLWDSLLKGRIELQKLVSIVNQLPQPDTWSKFLDQGGDSFQNKVKEGHSSLKRVLDELVQLQTALMLQYPDTRDLAMPGGKTPTTPNKSTSGPGDEDDEEITSESEGEHEEKQPTPTSPAVIKQKVKLADYPKFLAKRHKDFLSYRNNTIQKWYDKTRVATGKISKGFSAFEQSALKQIVQVLSDRDRLVKRTQLKRTVYRVLGKTEEQQTEQKDEEESQLPSREHLKDYDTEVFDDHDFYHQLLRELIERKTSDINDPVALSRQWLEIQKLRGKVKRKVDTRASKGRKVRYDIHPKLVNFMAPVESSSWTDEAKNDLYSSLFGQRHQRTAVATES